MMITFENENKYVITRTFFTELYFIEKNFNSWLSINKFNFVNSMKLYTYYEAELERKQMLETYPECVYNIISFEDIQTIIDANKYNL